MNTYNPDIQRLVRNLIRIGTVSELDLERGRCRVTTGGNHTDWLNWLTSRAGSARSWWAPSLGEQVLVLSLGGELDTAFVLPGIFSMTSRRRRIQPKRCISPLATARSLSTSRRKAP
ncbi:Phage P2 baseplate assembly protein gpV [Serratia rubidaea]|uniref:Phage P2 baseplate assembly protein gpV n=1 Tax=Serratia rubidaea TaxID=61652 RepID=A0A3S4JW88_SERRU|nr:Phage P2 baseplate assembly protein gpV [Serratia rubidaea]